MNFERLAPAVSGDVISPAGVSPDSGGFFSVCIDSRAACEGALFVALRGEARDGHDFVAEAFSKGACAALVSREAARSLSALARDGGKTLIAVDDTLAGLQDAAKAYLAGFSGLLKIGITGSVGKTTIKELASSIISVEKSVVASRGNYNSDTGLPLSVFEARDFHEVGVFEMGMNRRGEMAALAEVLRPDIALISTIGTAHVGMLGSRQAIAEEKKAIFSKLGEKGVAFVPEDSDFRDFLAQGLRGRLRFYGEKSLAGFEGARSRGLSGSEIAFEGQRIAFALPGRHNVANALAAIALAREAGASVQAVKSGLEAARPMFARAEILRLGRATVIRDCYNSSPESLAEAVAFCDEAEWPGRRVYVIGDMLELGAHSRKAHEDMGRLLAGSKADAVFLFGPETEAAEASMREAAPDRDFSRFCDIDELALALRKNTRQGDMVLLKGSRGCALERLCAAFDKKEAPGVSGNL